MKKKILSALILGLAFSIFMSFTGFDTNCNNLRKNILRLHIVANSDSDEDQALKLKVRDAILNCGCDVFGECEDIDEALSCAKDLQDEFTKTAQQVIYDNGFDYDVKVNIGNAFFGTREYDNFTLPAGIYEAVNIKIGKAEGKNWWCVMFPSLCINTASETSLKSSVGEDASYIAENPNKYEIRFKTVEIYEKIKKNLNK